MAERITVTLPDDLGKALADAARRTRRSRSEIVRAAIGDYLSQRPAERARAFIGSLASGIPDLAERHREYVHESLQRKHRPSEVTRERAKLERMILEGLRSPARGMTGKDWRNLRTTLRRKLHERRKSR